MLEKMWLHLKILTELSGILHKKFQQHLEASGQQGHFQGERDIF